MMVGPESATVSFTAPTHDGGTPITPGMVMATDVMVFVLCRQ